MLQVVLLSVFTTSFAFTTHRYDVYESYGAYRPVEPVTDNMFLSGNSNGRRPVQIYELPRRVDGGVANQGPVFNSNSERRWADVQYSYQYPYQRNYRPVPLNRVAVTEPTKYYNIFQNSDQNRKYDTGTVSQTISKEDDQAVNTMNEANKSNKTQENVPVTEISTQSNDVSRASVINEPQITWNYDKHSSNGDNANVTTQNVVSNHSNFNYLTPKQVTDKINRPRETNNTSVNNTKTKQFGVNTSSISDNNKVRNEPNDTVNRFNNENVTKVPRYGTKTTQDNEVTPKIELKAEKGEEDDRWVWSNADDKIVETTTLVDLDDRAAFSADGCPVGKVKVGDKCITRA